MAREPYTSAIRRAVPPWLQRTRGLRLMRALAERADALVDASVEGVALRFPGALGTIDPSALALTGSERRIRRGPGEPAARYARRLGIWWDSHRTRGGPYALLGQLHAYTVDWLNVPIDVVYHSGTRYVMDEAGEVTRDAITWNADGTSLWAQFWLFFHVPDTIPIGTSFIVTEDGDFMITEGGDFIIAEESIAPDELTPEEAAIFTAIPREWSAAHIKTIHVVLLWSTRRLWNYPQPVPTWAEWGASGALWGDAPVTLEITD